METADLYVALAIASGRPEDRFDHGRRTHYAPRVFAMLRGERPPEDDRERRALDYWNRGGGLIGPFA